MQLAKKSTVHSSKPKRGRRFALPPHSINARDALMRSVHYFRVLGRTRWQCQDAPGAWVSISLWPIISALQASGGLRNRLPGPALAVLAPAQAITWRAFSPQKSASVLSSVEL